MKIQIYTAITDNYDKSRNDILVFGEYDKFRASQRNYLIYKTLAHKFLDCDISVWIDGNLYLKATPEKLVEEWLGDFDMVIPKHPFRDCVYEEGMANIERIKHEKIGTEEILEQLKHYKEIGFPEHYGKLADTSFIIRRHNKIVEKFNEAWWAEICRYSYRDQVSFQYVLSKFPKLKVNFIESARNHPYFQYFPHLKEY